MGLGNKAAAAPEVPEALMDQLSEAGGRLVIPIGEQLVWQELQLVVRQKNNYETTSYDSVVFVPMLHGKESK